MWGELNDFHGLCLRMSVVALCHVSFSCRIYVRKLGFSYQLQMTG